jgi:FixJ family two-component response regulator
MFLVVRAGPAFRHHPFFESGGITNDTLRAIVAVVDDDPLILESLQDLLESAGHEVRSFSSAEALLQSDALDGIHCLISDIAMPGMDGMQLRTSVGASHPALPVILMTGRHELAERQRAAAPGCHVFVKPFDADALLAALASTLRAP